MIVSPTSVTLSAADLIIPAAKKLYLDAGGDTYISESSGNVLDFVTFGSAAFRLTASVASVLGSRDLTIPSTKKFYLDGGSNTYMYEVSSDIVYFYAGAAFIGGFTPNGTMTAAGKKHYFDGGGDTYIWENTGDILDFVIGGVAPVFRLTTGGAALTATKKLYLDGGGDTYFVNPTTDRMDTFCGGALSMYVRTAALVSGVMGDWSLAATKKLYLDGGNDTYFRESSGNVIRFTAGAIDAFDIKSTGVVSWKDITLAATKKLYLDGGGDTYMHEISANIQAWVTGNTETVRYAVTGVVFNESGADRDFRVEGDSLARMLWLDGRASSENIALLANATPNWQTMDRGVFIGNADSAPTGNPSGGGFMWVQAGALKWRGSSGTITTLGAA